MRHCVKYQTGDWIIVEGSPIQIAAIHQKKVGDHRWPGRLSWVRLDQIQTIPLTPDFLMKNGFTKTRDGCHEWQQNTGNGFFYVSLRNISEGSWNMIVQIGDHLSGDRSRKEVTGRFLKVHQIQHEFVSEGIKKEFVV
jgi:hypothetical protein